MGNYKKIYFNTRYMIPVMVGIIVGFTFSLFCIPFYDCENRVSHLMFTSNLSKNELNILRLRFDLKPSPAELLFNEQQQKQKDDFEPRINLQGKPRQPQKPIKKLTRPRYISTELNIRKKLFIGILSTTNKLTSFATFLNQTIASYSDRLVFFINFPELNEKVSYQIKPYLKFLICSHFFYKISLTNDIICLLTKLNCT
jgi:hypothetical protein